MVLIFTINPLLNVYKSTVNSARIRLFLKKYDVEKVYQGRFPFLSKFIGYTTKKPMQDQRGLYYITLECSFHPQDTKLVIDHFRKNEKQNVIIIVEKKVISGIEIENYLKK